MLLAPLRTLSRALTTRRGIVRPAGPPARFAAG